MNLILRKSLEIESVDKMRDPHIYKSMTRSEPHILVDDIEKPELSEEKLHHLKRVRRIKTGSNVTATDGRGAWGVFRFTGELLENADAVYYSEKREPAITIAISITKSGKLDLTVQKLTEIGVDELILFTAENSVPIWSGPKKSKNEQRLNRIIQSALEQSKGIWMPKLSFLPSFSDVAQISGMAMADYNGEQITGSCRCLAIGPEGGWSPAEDSLNLPKVSLSNQVLRAETAAIVGASLMSAYGDIE